MHWEAGRPGEGASGETPPGLHVEPAEGDCQDRILQTKRFPNLPPFRDRQKAKAGCSQEAFLRPIRNGSANQNHKRLVSLETPLLRARRSVWRAPRGIHPRWLD